MTTAETNRVHVLALAAHPDDIELSCGGAVRNLTRQGKRVAIVDCTEGELSSRGTIETRRMEARKAGEILGISDRMNLGMSDGNIEISPENIRKLIAAIRYYQPEILLMPSERERHPDHENVHRLARTAVFQSGLVKISTQWNGVAQSVHRPKKMFCFMQTYDFEPDFYVNITEDFDDKVRAIQAYSTQVSAPDSNASDGPQTFISRPEFLEFLIARSRYFGEKVGVRYAEAFYSVEPILVESLSLLL